MRGRLTRAEKAVDGYITTASCPECGQAFRYAGDLAGEVVLLEWVRETGEDHATDPTVERVLDHPHEDLLHTVLRDIPALRDDRAR